MNLDEIVSSKQEYWRRVTGNPRLVNGRSRPARLGTFGNALRRSDVAVIAEVKPASPTKGALLPVDRAPAMARTYDKAGASAVSVLADSAYFGGSPELVASIAADPAVTVPVLYKDFVVDERQVHLAWSAGADAVLLIVRYMEDDQLRHLLQTAHGLGLDALVETFTERDIDRALAAGADIIGINNRDLQTFRVDLENSAKLRSLLPADVLSVSESGIGGREDLMRLAGHGFDACLIGETLLTAADPGQALRDLLDIPVGRSL